MASKKTRVLVADDDTRVLRMMQHAMEAEGHEVLLASDGLSALRAFEAQRPDLVLLDIMMPGIDGQAVCAGIREFSDVPVIMVTAKGSDEDKVRALDAGADDYIEKPFSFDELTARVNAVLRRTESRHTRPAAVFEAAGLTVDFSGNTATLDGQRLNLTATEFRLLSYLARNAGRVLTPDQIICAVWGDDYAGDHNVLQVNIARLRRKLGDHTRPSKFIVTRHGMGYVFGSPQS